MATWENEKSGQLSGCSGECMDIGQEVSLLIPFFMYG